MRQNGVMATEKWTPERRRQLTRDALIDAAAEVFAKRGFHGASLDEIAETAGFTRGAIYKNFGGKEDLFFAVNEEINQRALEGFAELLGSTGVGDVAAIAAKWKELIVGDFQFFTLVLEFNLDAMRNPDLHQRLIERRRHSTQMVAKFVEEQSARAGVKLAMPSEDLANIFLITTDGFTHAAAIDPDTARLYEPFLELLIAALLVNPSEVAAEGLRQWTGAGTSDEATAAP